ncbi:hypothetical protein IEO21_05632 [Rhodonia placenta]|uniref:Purine-cytosine permease n=1 Tax=Rhodonia placenta TaxID=104341 RepID=A0A8H7P1J4_9APHY|nr:hypothetical protein IEO21_05632 [Postia placenta]
MALSFPLIAIHDRIAPVPPENRTDTRLYQLFFIWFSANANILTLTAGTVGPAFYGLGIRESFLMIIVVDVITCAVPAMFAVFGPKLGTRAMVQSRFAWGYYGAIIPSVLNVISSQGYLIINTIIGGQVLGSVSTHVNATIGIVIIGLITLALVFSGYRVLHWYETFVWIPNVIALVVMLGVSGKHITKTALTNPAPVSVSTLMTAGATLAATNVSWSPLTPDYGVYHDRKASSWRIFIYVYLGLLTSSMPAHLLGAALTATAYHVPSWEAGLGNGNDIGGLVAAILSPAGGFGKFLLVLLALASPSQCAPSMYTACTSFMTISAVLARIPRFALSIISTIILIPVAIVGSSRFYATFVDILGFIGYWNAPFCAIVLAEHFVFRKNRWSSYHVLDAWNKPDHPNLARGYAAVFTFVAAIGVIVMCMDQAWWVGPIARAGTGDIGMLCGFTLSIPLFVCARWLERVWSGVKHVG